MKNAHRTIYLLSPYCRRPSTFPESSLEYIRFYLKDHGYQARRIDCSHYPRDLDAVMGILKETEDPVIGVTAYTRERFFAYELIRRVKTEIPASTLVVGGRHFGFLAQETLEALPEVDIVVRGEGEITFKEICDRLTRGRTVDDVTGISFRRAGRIVHNAERPLETDLDRFRNFDVNDLPDTSRYKLTFPSKFTHKGYFTVSATRGCPNSCVFCSLKASRVRFRSVEKIIEEIEQKIALTGTRHVTFNDASLTNNKEFITRLCRALVDRRLNIKWNCYSRVNIDLDVLTLMKKAGLVSVEIGLESGSPRILKVIRKNIKVEQVEQFVQRAHRLGIKVYVFSLISLPEETLEDVDMTYRVLERLAPYIYRAGIQTTRILPDAPLYQIAREKGVLPADFNWFDPYTAHVSELVADPVFENIPLYLENMTEKEIEGKIRKFHALFDKYFMHPDMVLRVLKRNFNRKALRSLTWAAFVRKAKKAAAIPLYLWETCRNRCLKK